ncbi:sulfatase family protein [Pelagicoccus mobilis]|uniref:Arylsulfatase n=1 Tax=Pelagicoccus mobilis TaxID=415221 RepID=A0A934RVB1_9BACT|nr:arylsulfatase [Pelagicoccus mobilis]MBK1875804.1 arylsulfatase [Pelagicoccus mobilis]
MNYRRFLTTLLATLAFALSANASKPNIIYILADDMGQGDVHAYNKNSKIPTPHLDRLAAEGMTFMDGHTSSGVCTPTRYGILTGRYSWRTPTLKQGVLGGHSPHLIDPDRETVASLLQKEGYKTACIGKWHLGMDWTLTDPSKTSQRVSWKYVDPKGPIKNGPNSIGFDYFFGISASLNMDPHAYVENDKLLGTLEVLKNLDEVNARGYTQPSKPGYAAKEYVQQEVLIKLAEKTSEWIHKHKDSPFFVYLPLPSPHSPIVPSDRFLNKSGLNLHGDFCMESDWVLGEVLKALDETGTAENTIVIFTADNGTSPKAEFKEMAEQGHNSSWIYRGMKGTNWEGGHRVPFIVRWPAEIKAGTRSDELICTTDLMATCVDILDTDIADNMAEDSVSFLPALKGKEIREAKGRVVVHHSDKGIFSIRQGKWKVMFDDFGGSNRGDPRKDEPIENAAPLQLFDMVNDPTEDVNLAAKYPEVVESLKKGLAEVIQSGRSTPGEDQPTDLAEAWDSWTQLDPVREYLER